MQLGGLFVPISRLMAPQGCIDAPDSLPSALKGLTVCSMAQKIINGDKDVSGRSGRNGCGMGSAA